ncbi:MAG: OmpA family protein [Flavobacteriales bacterium]|nr:OmpA family protein [Flavobacteriales bacterium]MBT7481766.1 OmpA family protein [Flavobacteriales bacterium]
MVTESNNKLGKERSEEVIRYLVETFGIERSRCVTFSNGEAKPITTNNNTSNEFSNNYLREINRRVDFQIIY